MHCYTYFEYGQVVMIRLLISPYVSAKYHILFFGRFWSIRRKREGQNVLSSLQTGLILIRLGI
jgi:hypothetical protein